MKFDCVIMNPPYKRNLHLKILAKAIKVITDDGIAVNISPIRWLQDQTAEFKHNTEYKRYEESVSKHIEDLELITGENARNFFDNAIMTNEAIYKCTKAGGFDYANLAPKLLCFDKITRRISEGKIDNLKRHMKVYHEENIKNGVKMSLIHGHPGKKDFYDVITPNAYFAKICLLNSHVKRKDFYDVITPNKNVAVSNLKDNMRYFSFATENERDNFYESLKSIYMKYCLYLCKTNQHILPQFLPWLGDYTHPWTDDDICNFLDINEDEKKQIKKIMEKYDYEV